MKDIQLYISGKQIEFNKEPSILYNYLQTDLTNPTTVKNSFSKTITIEGTRNNNAIFGNIWALDRLQEYSTGTYSGAYFNPLLKADFVLYVNGEIYESGYIKLDEVIKNKGLISYKITLFGGLGSFFYTLTYNEDGDKLTLNDLRYTIDNEEPDLDFVINKDTISEAWNNINEGKWGIINFATAYNGIPENFDANKCLVNSKDMASGFTFSESGFTTYNGFALGEMNDDMTEWEIRDIRSYLQRPVIRMRSIIEACCNPEVNGGYEVQLDSRFFDSSDESKNPYYEDAWVTLPKITELVEGGQTVSASTATLSQDKPYFYRINSDISMAEFTNVSLGLSVGFKPKNTAVTANELFTSYRYEGKISGVQRGRVEYSRNNGALLVQLLARDASNVIVGSSDVYYLHTTGSDLQPDFNLLKPKWDNLDGVEANVKYVAGRYLKNDDKYYFCDVNGNEQALGFSLTTQTPFDYLQLKIVPLFYRENAYRDNGRIVETYLERWLPVSPLKNYYFNGNKTMVEVNALLGNYDTNLYYDIVDFNLIGEDLENLYSNTLITKKDLLSTENTPCDYLLSFCKMFGLYFYKNPAEQSELDNCPNGVIHIMDREAFYKKDGIIDINDIIDRDKDINITPQIPESKWYDFNIEQIESEANEEYKSSHKQDYGIKHINTGYNFDNEKTDLLDNNIFKGGIDVLETSKYYKGTNEGLPCYVWNGFSYSLFKMNTEGYDTLEKEFEVKAMTGDTINLQNIANADMMSKVQLHGKENSSIDGSNILLFYRGNKRAKVDSPFYLTDDVHEMVVVNDATPCWIMTNSEYNTAGERIAYRVDEIPWFTRTIVQKSTGKIIDSWDMGETDITYVANTYVTQPMSIYDRCWKSYFEDMYNVNSRKLSCYCLLNEAANPEWLRRFYWFDNSIWRLNAIKDWDVASYNTTKMEFIKVQDVNNYTSLKPTVHGEVTIYLDNNEIDNNANIINGNISLQDDGAWSFAENGLITYEDGTTETFPTSGLNSWVNPYEGTGNTAFVISVPRNNTLKNRDITFAINHDFRTVYFNVKQHQSYLIVNPLQINAPMTGGTFNIEYQSDSMVITEKDKSWINLLYGDNEIVVSLMRNNSANSRFGNVILTNDKEEVNIPIVQDGIQLEVSPTVMGFDGNGGTQNATYVTNVSNITCSSDSSWLSAYINVTNNIIGVMATINDSTRTRHGTITVSAGLVTRTISVGQVPLPTVPNDGNDNEDNDDGDIKDPIIDIPDKPIILNPDLDNSIDNTPTAYWVDRTSGSSSTLSVDNEGWVSLGTLAIPSAMKQVALSYSPPQPKIIDARIKIAE